MCCQKKVHSHAHLPVMDVVAELMIMANSAVAKRIYDKYVLLILTVAVHLSFQRVVVHHLRLAWSLCIGVACLHSRFLIFPTIVITVSTQFSRPGDLKVSSTSANVPTCHAGTGGTRVGAIILTNATLHFAGSTEIPYLYRLFQRTRLS